MFTFYIENHEPSGSLTKSCLYLDKNKSIVSTFSIFVDPVRTGTLSYRSASVRSEKWYGEGLRLHG